MVYDRKLGRAWLKWPCTCTLSLLNEAFAQGINEVHNAIWKISCTENVLILSIIKAWRGFIIHRIVTIFWCTSRSVLNTQNLFCQFRQKNLIEVKYLGRAFSFKLGSFTWKHHKWTACKWTLLKLKILLAKVWPYWDRFAILS